MNDRTGLHRRRWTPAATPKAALVLIHGAGEHCGRYEHVAAYFTAQGYEVVSGDLPGHGRSPGVRGHIGSFGEFIDAAAGWIAQAEEEAEGRPIFLLGHSMGGLISLRLAETHPAAEKLAGIIATSPALRIKMRIPRWKLAAGQLLRRVAPGVRLPTRLESVTRTKDPEIARAASEDPYMHGMMSVQFFYEFTDCMERTILDAGRIRRPICVLHGGADELIDPDATLEFARRLAVEDREVEILPGLHHEIMNEPERADVLRRIAGWMDRRIPGA